MSDARDLRAAAAGPLARRFPARWLEEHAVLPLTVQDGVARVAADGTPPVQVQDALERELQAAIVWIGAGAGDIRAALVATPRLLANKGSSDSSSDGSSDGSIAPAAARGESAESLDDLRALASREPVVQVVNAMMSEAARAGASDIHIESEPETLRIRMRLDGVLRDAQRLGPEFRAAVISRLKVLAGLDIAERRVPQDGRARIRVGERELDVRVSTVPALHGESVVLRLLDGGGAQPLGLEALGLAEDTLVPLRALLHQSAGLLLVTGPTGAGKTTTLYAALRERSSPGVKVVTVEDPVEYRLDGVVQLPVNPRAGFTFAQALRAMLRHDPDVMLVGEMRDAETADIAVRAALTGHLVLSTVHTTDAVGALARLRDMNVAPYLIAATLKGVVAQRLVRRLCDGCATWHAPAESEQALLGVSVTRVRSAAGCASCAGTGYRGRLAVTELLVMREAMAQAFTEGASLAQLRAMARADGSRSLQDDGVRAVREGWTSVAELARVLSDEHGA